MDMLFKDARSRTLRSRTEVTATQIAKVCICNNTIINFMLFKAPTRNFRHHEILEAELESLQPRT